MRDSLIKIRSGLNRYSNVILKNSQKELNVLKKEREEKAARKEAREGRKLVDEREKDFEFLFLMKNTDSYIFTSESSHHQMLSRETIKRDVNRVMHSVSKSLPDQPNITSNSFRVGYISQLWKDTKDIEFVKQSIGHRRMDTTSSYVEKLSDQERQERTLKYKIVKYTRRVVERSK